MADKVVLKQGKYLVGMNSIVGDTRRQYEDRAKVLEIHTAGGLDLLVSIVADGVGSADNGGLAAQMSIDSVITFFQQSDEKDIPHLIVNAIKFANHVVYKDVITRNVDASTTIVVGVIHDDRFYVGNVGDSRAYWIQESGKMIQLTLDHNYYNLKGGDPNAPTAEMLINAIGIQKDVFVDVGFYIKGNDRKIATKIGLAGLPLKLGETILLCSDGLIKTNAKDERFVTDEEILDALRTEIQPNAAAVRMTGYTEGRYVDDNVSVVTVQYTSPKSIENVLHRQVRQKQLRQLRYAGLAVLGVGVIIGGIFAIRALSQAEGKITALENQPTSTPYVLTPTPLPSATPIQMVAAGQARVDYLIEERDGAFVQPSGTGVDSPMGLIVGETVEFPLGVDQSYKADLGVTTRSIGVMISIASKYSTTDNNRLFIYPQSRMDVKYLDELELTLQNGSIYIDLAEGGRESAKVTFPNQGNAVAEVSGSRMLLTIIGQDVELWCLEGECRLDFSDGSGYKTAANMRRKYLVGTNGVEAENQILMGLYAEIWDWNIRCGNCMVPPVPTPTPTPTPTALPPTEEATKTPLFFKNTLPSINISAPANGASFVEGTTITFTAAAYDEEDEDLGSKIVWTEGGTQLGVGVSIIESGLAIGSHTITATVTDSTGASASRSVTITVTKKPNEKPTINISSPSNGATYVEGDTVSFSATASDKEDDNLSSSIKWTEGATLLHTGASFSKDDFSIDSHTITATVTDTGGASASASVTITVNEKPNNPPTVTITEPTTASFEEGTLVTFKATATDTEDGDIKSQIVWSEGGTQLAIGASFSKGDFSVGSHTITAAVTDSGGKTASASITITITEAPPPNTAPTIAITYPADGDRFLVNTSITFTATAIDAQDGDLSSSIKWYFDGDLKATGSSWTRSFSKKGDKTITTRVTDTSGVTTEDSVTITITAPTTDDLTLPISSLLIRLPFGDHEIVIIATPSLIDEVQMLYKFNNTHPLDLDRIILE